MPNVPKPKIAIEVGSGTGGQSEEMITIKVTVSLRKKGLGQADRVSKTAN